MDGARLVGVLTYGDLLRGLAEQGANLSVQQAMRAELETASPSEALDGALTRMHQGECRVLMVVENEKVVGLLTVGNIGELLALDAAGRQTGPADARAGGGDEPMITLRRANERHHDRRRKREVWHTFYPRTERTRSPTGSEPSRSSTRTVSHRAQACRATRIAMPRSSPTFARARSRTRTRWVARASSKRASFSA